MFDVAPDSRQFGRLVAMLPVGERAQVAHHTTTICWIASEPGGNRLVITGLGWLAPHALFATIDPKTGALALDPHVIDFDREWPDGWNGPAMPHGAVFSNEPATIRWSPPPVSPRMCHFDYRSQPAATRVLRNNDGSSDNATRSDQAHRIAVRILKGPR